jgi:hypothetical protein
MALLSVLPSLHSASASIGIITTGRARGIPSASIGLTGHGPVVIGHMSDPDLGQVIIARVLDPDSGQVIIARQWRQGLGRAPIVRQWVRAPGLEVSNSHKDKAPGPEVSNSHKDKAPGLVVNHDRRGKARVKGRSKIPAQGQGTACSYLAGKVSIGDGCCCC